MDTSKDSEKREAPATEREADDRPQKKAKKESKKKASSKGKAQKKESKEGKEGKSKSELEDYPIIDLSAYINKGKKGSRKDKWMKDCKKICDLFHQFGFIVVKDPRVPHKHNDTFIDLMERYYGQDEEIKSKDVRKHLHYQVGITPTRTERAREHCTTIEKLGEGEKPLTLCPPDLDNKLRFFWRMGDIPPQTEFKQLNAEPVIPAAFPEWKDVLNTWGGLILGTVYTVSEMAAQGWGMKIDTFTSLLKFGPHLLAPTGSDFGRFGKLGTILANFHYDLNFITIHGRSRFPGLFVWTRSGKKIPVKVPEDCLLLQAGKQFEYLTGGYVLAGFHEVVVTEKTVEAIEAARAAGRSLWRVSSTLFSHTASDNTLEPIGKFATEETKAKYPAVKAGKQVQEELNAIKLGQDEHAAM
jgi:isopenicillin N synthase-like dioxygenase